VTGFHNGSMHPFPIFPAVGAIQPTYGGGSTDAYVTELNSAGSALVYSTYLGGGGSDSGKGIVVDKTGQAYVTGYTTSGSPTPFPTTGGAYQLSLSGSQDAFVSKLNATGTSLVYSTYLGGGNSESGNGIAVDKDGYAYVTGFTNSGTPTPFPTTVGAYQTN